MIDYYLHIATFFASISMAIVIIFFRKKYNLFLDLSDLEGVQKFHQKSVPRKNFTRMEINAFYETN